MILDIVKQSYATEVIQNELLVRSHDSVMLGGSSKSPADSAIELFQKMRKHCNFLSDLDSLGDMNNAQKLRDVI